MLGPGSEPGGLTPRPMLLAAVPAISFPQTQRNRSKAN